MKITPFLGTLSGKLGGVVASRNKAGAYLRSWVKPVDPKTIAQVLARTNFGIAANNYHSLTPTQKAAWGNFGMVYVPKHSIAAPGLSGFNTFIGMNNTANQAFSKQGTATYKKAGVTITGTTVNYAASVTPPVFMLESNIIVTVAAAPVIVPISWNTTNNSFSLSNGWQASINIQGGLITPGDLPVTGVKDANGNAYGFAMYISKGMVQAGMFVEQSERYLAGTAAPFSPTAPSTAISELRVLCSNVLSGANYQALPVVGDIVQATLYQIGVNGMCRKLGSQLLTVTT